MAPPSKLTPEQWAIVEKWERDRIPRPEQAERIQAQFGVTMTRANLARAHGRRDPVQPRSENTKVFKIYLSPEQMERVRAVAASHGFRDKVAINTGNASQMLRAIAEGDLSVTPRKTGQLR